MKFIFLCSPICFQSTHIAENNLIGELPPEIGKLNGLTELKLDDNCIYGTIPSEVWKLPLIEIDFEWNVLNGLLSSELYQLSDLTRLNLGGNSREASCNHTDGTVFIAESAGIGGEIFGPHIGKLSNLREIVIYGNKFNGTISSAIGVLSNLGE
jgi:Leucine-rich repeat (LRR) protein